MVCVCSPNSGGVPCTDGLSSLHRNAATVGFNSPCLEWLDGKAPTTERLATCSLARASFKVRTRAAGSPASMIRIIAPTAYRKISSPSFPDFPSCLLSQGIHLSPSRGRRPISRKLPGNWTFICGRRLCQQNRQSREGHCPVD